MEGRKKGGSHIKVKEAKFPVVVGMGPVSWLPEKSLERKKEERERKRKKEKEKRGLKNRQVERGIMGVYM